MNEYSPFIWGSDTEELTTEIVPLTFWENLNSGSSQVEPKMISSSTKKVKKSPQLTNKILHER